MADTLIEPLTSTARFDALLGRIGHARIVMLGEASHGTRDYYRWRELLTRRLVGELGFGFIAVEGDWPDCDRVHRAVTGGGDPQEALHAFARWPTWMWANEEVGGFCRWLRDWNLTRPPARRAGFHGLDVYSLIESLQAIVDHVRAHDGDDLDAVWHAVRCFEPYRQDPQRYAWATRMVSESCEPEVIKLLGQARAQAAGSDARFAVWQNAEVVAGAERYYRAMMRGGPESWNVRDVHMADTLDRLLEHYGPRSKAVVWAHNTHVGDARATDMADDGMVNIGQLARERHGDDRVVLVGFAGHRGEVVAAPRWGAPSRVMTVPPARRDSLEHRLHSDLPPTALAVFGATGRPGWQDRQLGHRAIGVVYHPDLEPLGNYVPTRVGDRYDAVIWCDETDPVRPIHAQPMPGELETYPSGM